MKYEEATKIAQKYGQGHILLAYERLDETQKEKFLNQILSINFEQLKNLYNQTKQKKKFDNIEITPINFINEEKLTKEEKAKYIETGENIIKNGKYAIVMLAGGQGTRLGHNGPKGTFDLGLESHKTLFEIFCDKLKLAKEKYGVTIPWYIMTSRENNEATESFFKKNNYFGYDGIKCFFKQNELPMLDEEGKVIIDKNNFIKEAADGHGGLFEAIIQNGLFEEMKKEGVEWVYTCGIDNVLANLVDPLFIGFSKENNYKVSSIALMKKSAQEKVGVFCKKNGKPGVIEYTEISEELANAINDDGEYVYGAAHIMINLFNIEVIEELSKEKLPYHIAHKKSEYMNEKGEYIIAEKPNAYKFEAFIFDAFERIDEMGILLYKRENCFAPIKNKEGEDSPETAKILFENYNKK